VFYFMYIYVPPVNRTYVNVHVQEVRTSYMLPHKYVYTDMYNYMLENKYDRRICCQACNYTCLYVWSVCMFVCVCVSLYCQYVSCVLASRTSRTHTHKLVSILLYLRLIQAPLHRPHPLLLFFFMCVLILLSVASCYYMCLIQVPLHKPQHLTS
jgi:hypothetical protein